MRIVVPEKDTKSSQQAQNHWSLQTRIFLNVCSVAANKVDVDTREEFADWIWIHWYFRGNSFKVSYRIWPNELGL